MRFILLLALLGACECGTTSSLPDALDAPIPPPWIDESYRPRIVVGTEASCVTLRDGVACWGSGGALFYATPPYAGDAIRPTRIANLGRVEDLVPHAAIDEEGNVLVWASPHAEPVPQAGPPARAFTRDYFSATAYERYVTRDNRYRYLVHRPLATPMEVVDDLPIGDVAASSAGIHLRSDGAVFIGTERAPFDGVQLADGIVVTTDGRLMQYLVDGWEERDAPEPIVRVSRDARCLVGASGDVYDEGERFQLDAIDVDCSREHGCAISRSGEVACWGSNIRGELGDGTTNDSEQPVRVMGLDLSAAQPLLMPLPDAQCLEPDEDGDGVSSRWESTRFGCPGVDLAPDVDEDGLLPSMDDDSDGDGFPDRVEALGNACEASPMSDGDSIPDFLDVDSDNDGVWDVDELDLEASRSPDRDGDGCGDLFEMMFGGCESDAVLLRESRPDSMLYEHTFSWVASRGSSLVRASVEDSEVLRGCCRGNVLLTAASTDAEAYTEGYEDAGFRDVSAGDVLEVRVGRGVSAARSNGTVVERSDLVLRDEGGTELYRRTFVSVGTPVTVCVGP